MWLFAPQVNTTQWGVDGRGFAPPHTLSVCFCIQFGLPLFQQQRVCAASVVSRGEKERKLPTSRLHYSASAGWSRAIHFASGEKGQRRCACACAAPHEMNKSARTRRLAASEQSKRCSWTSDAACGATALSPPPLSPPDCRLRPQPSPTKGQCLIIDFFTYLQ